MPVLCLISLKEKTTKSWGCMVVPKSLALIKTLEVGNSCLLSIESFNFLKLPFSLKSVSYVLKLRMVWSGLLDHRK